MLPDTETISDSSHFTKIEEQERLNSKLQRESERGGAERWAQLPGGSELAVIYADGNVSKVWLSEWLVPAADSPGIFEKVPLNPIWDLTVCIIC